MAEYVDGVHLHRTDENVAEIDALASLTGGRAGLDAMLADLDRIGRPARAMGRAVDEAFTWDSEDRRTRLWYPQGISTSADASDTEDVGGRRLLVVTWYARDTNEPPHGVRVTFVDLATLRYRHVLLVMPQLLEDGSVQVAPLRVHAGGVVWCGPYLHVAATARGLVTCRLDDLLRIPDDRAGGDRRLLGVEGDRVASFGYRYVLPVRFTYQAFADEGHSKLRYSFMSLDRHCTPPQLVAGEYATGGQTRRLVRYPLDPETMLLASSEDGRARPLMLDDGGVARMQGATMARDTYFVSVSYGPFWPGSVYVGRPAGFRKHLWASPMGPEDIAYWPSTGRLWSLSEHPYRRWVYAMDRSWFG